MGVLVHLPDPFNPLRRTVHRLDRPVTVRRLVQRHKGLRPFTQVCRPGGVYGRRRVREFTRPTVCLLNGVPLLRRDWKRATVGPADIVAFHAPPMGGGNNTLVTILMVVAAIAIAVAAPYIAGPAVLGFTAGTLAYAATTAAISVGLTAALYGAMSLFVTPPAPEMGTGFAGATPATSPVYNLTAQGNYARLQQAIPEPLGRNRLFPDFVASAYQHFDDDNNQFIHQILGLGVGEYEIDEASMKLGDTPITSYEDVQWSLIPPGELSDTTIADERWITSRDLADIELLDNIEGSPWAGPYAANPAGTYITTFEVDVAAPRGLWAFDTTLNNIVARQVVFEMEAQQIDDLGAPVGAGTWETFPPVTWLRAQREVLRLTVGPLDLPVAGRWQVRMRRTDVKYPPPPESGHQLDWIGLRGRVAGRRRFQGMTCIALKMKAGKDLTASQSRQFNLVATRKLPTWDGAAMGTALVATRSPCDAFAHIARTQNGGKLRDDQIALADLYAGAADFDDNQWTFDFVFDQGVTVSEALARVARAVVAERVTQGGRLHLVRDVPVAAPVAMFSPRNIAPGSLSIQYVMPDSTSPDSLIGTYIDQTVWRPVDVTVAFEDSAQLRPTRMTMHGCGTRDQARAVLWNIARSDRYRRRVVGWTAPMEGLAVTFGDGISFSHDVPRYGQTLEVIEFDGGSVVTFADPPDFSAGGTFYAALRDSVGRKAGPFVATAVAGQPFQLSLAGTLPEILTGGDRERTWLQLGPGEAYARNLKVKQVTPRDAMSADIVAFDDDARLYEPIPDEPPVPIGADTSPITIAITSGDGPVANLRTIANAHDYTGLAVQQVTFTVAAGVDLAIVRGSWPPGSVPILDLAGTLSGLPGAAGAGGAGGDPTVGFVGNGGTGGIGGIGGSALDSTTGALVLTGAGTIRGGRGGGGGGGGGGGVWVDTFDPDTGTGAVIGYGGTGGAGNGGTGVPGGPTVPPTGAMTGSGGNGGAAGDYAAAGSPGAAGTAATGGTYNGAGGPGSAGGAGGQPIAGSANVDLAGFTGTIGGSGPSGPTIAFRSLASLPYASRTNTTLAAPAGLANGDILIAIIVTGAAGGAPTPTPPAGFSAFGTATSVTDPGTFNGRMNVWWKRAAGESGSYGFSHASCSSQGLLTAWSGCLASGTPLAATSSNTGAGGTTSTGTSITTTAANSVLLWLSHNWVAAGGLDPPAGMTERFDGLIFLADQLIASAGATGNRTQDNGNSGAPGDQWAVRMVELLNA